MHHRERLRQRETERERERYIYLYTWLHMYIYRDRERERARERESKKEGFVFLTRWPGGFAEGLSGPRIDVKVLRGPRYSLHLGVGASEIKIGKAAAWMGSRLERLDRASRWLNVAPP